jgi:hypothetical protein
MPLDLADTMSLEDEKDTPVYSMVRKEASPEDFQDTEWGWDEYK